jgi:hypothetical protein
LPSHARGHNTGNPRTVSPWRARAHGREHERFETDPEHYTAGSTHEQPIYLDAPLAAEFLAYSRDVDKNSATWVKKQQGYLAWWADQLKGRDLLKVTLLDDILPALERAKARGIESRSSSASTPGCAR